MFRAFVILASLCTLFSPLAQAQNVLTLNVTSAENNWEIEGRTEDELIDYMNSNFVMRSFYSFEMQAYPFYDQRVGEGCWMCIRRS
ncbi:hypothetical protein [Hyphobacterium sp.]|uniref:hypothetical protein n=1 Tax=Hyphobacterium sp. TaxID=2004662 RepID=UPI003BACDA75